MNVDTRSNADTTYYDSITTRIPAGRWGDVCDFKGPAIFLASKASSYVSGEILVVRRLPITITISSQLTILRSMVGGWPAEVNSFCVEDSPGNDLRYILACAFRLVLQIETSLREYKWYFLN